MALASSQRVYLQDTSEDENDKSKELDKHLWMVQHFSQDHGTYIEIFGNEPGAYQASG
jgi:hypothetical protein